MIERALLDRNVSLVRKRMLEQLEASLHKGGVYINSELEGSSNILIRPIVRTFYDVSVKPILRDGSRGNLDLVIEIAKEIILDPSKDLDALIEKNFHRYLKNDETARFSKKKHRNYPWFVENMKQTFVAQAKQMIQALSCEDPDAKTYDELMISVFQNAENARAALAEQLDCMEKGIEKLQSDPTIMDVPVGRDLITRVLIRGVKDTRAELMSDLDEVFKDR
jgi:hypothetical protein